MNSRSQLIVKSNFTHRQDLQDAVEALATLTGSQAYPIEIYIKGLFKIANRSEFTNELNLNGSWYEVTKIGRRYITVHVPSEGRSFQVEPYHEGTRGKRAPYFCLVAENLSRIKVISY